MFNTRAEELWAGEKGDAWTHRTSMDKIIRRNMIMFSKLLKQTGTIESVLEFGSNTGQNFKALSMFFPDCQFAGIEINHEACEMARRNYPQAEIFEQSAIEPFKLEKTYDLVLTYGFLIHINEEFLQQVYRTIYETSKKFIAIYEYYNPTPVDVEWHGETGVLVKRDFAGEMLDMFPDLTLIDYGFGYRRDKYCNFDDINWFLIKK